MTVKDIMPLYERKKEELKMFDDLACFFEKNPDLATEIEDGAECDLTLSKFFIELRTTCLDDLSEYRRKIDEAVIQD